MSTLEKAIEIAAAAHAGQVDKAGEPYILHPLRVMLSVNSKEERIAAVLHDVIEDTEVKLDDLRESGFSEEIINAVEHLTKVKGETYDDFIKRVLNNKIAINVKIADLKDNMNLSRISNPTEKDYIRVEKYKKALDIINNSFKITKED